MADWLTLSPDETQICRSRQTVKGALILAGGAVLQLAIAIPLGGAILFVVFDASLLPLPRMIAIVVGAALEGGLLTILVVYRAIEFVVTDCRVIYRRGLIMKRQTEMRLDDIAEIKAEAKVGVGRPFKLISTAGRSLTVATLADLDRLRRTLVRETGLPDPMAG